MDLTPAQIYLGGQPPASVPPSSCTSRVTPPARLLSSGTNMQSSPNATPTLSTRSKQPQDQQPGSQTLARMTPALAREVLAQGPYLPEGSVFSTKTAALILQQVIDILPASSKAKYGNIFCAVAVLLDEVDTGHLISVTQAQLSPALEKMNSTAIRLESTQLKLDATIRKLDTLPRSNTTGSQPLLPQDALGSQPSYALVAAVPHAKAIADSAWKNCQVSIKLARLNDNDPHSLGNLSPHELVTKANLALDNIAMDEAGCPDRVTIIAACRSGIFLHLEANSTNAAQWLKRNHILQLFGDNFDSTSTPMPSSFKLMAEFVPTSYQPGPSMVYADLELVNDVEEDKCLVVSSQQRRCEWNDICRSSSSSEVQFELGGNDNLDSTRVGTTV
ncbi:hypothetical protein BDQ17DRAFT_1365765 [Cyathus striatus]|nr:hypothetical protein BDQ17DRAFT_1365765 [Cyathus striatus]